MDFFTSIRWGTLHQAMNEPLAPILRPPTILRGEVTSNKLDASIIPFLLREIERDAPTQAAAMMDTERMIDSPLTDSPIILLCDSY